MGFFGWVGKKVSGTYVSVVNACKNRAEKPTLYDDGSLGSGLLRAVGEVITRREDAARRKDVAKTARPAIPLRRNTVIPLPQQKYARGVVNTTGGPELIVETDAHPGTKVSIAIDPNCELAPVEVQPYVPARKAPIETIKPPVIHNPANVVFMATADYQSGKRLERLLKDKSGYKTQAVESKRADYTASAMNEVLHGHFLAVDAEKLPGLVQGYTDAVLKAAPPSRTPRVQLQRSEQDVADRKAAITLETIASFRSNYVLHETDQTRSFEDYLLSKIETLCDTEKHNAFIKGESETDIAFVTDEGTIHKNAIYNQLSLEGKLRFNRIYRKYRTDYDSGILPAVAIRAA
jgi:hypothetical protein